MSDAPPRLDLLPRQHATRPHLLANALVAARQAAPHLDGLAHRMLPSMPRKPRASQNLRSISVIHYTSPMLLDDALTCPWMATDSTDVRNALLLDGDHADWLDRWLALPASIRPDLVVDPWSGRFHAVLQLADPVPMTAAARMGPQLMADLAGRLLAAAMGAKLLPPGSLIKSPWGQAQHLIGERRKLGTNPAFPELWQRVQADGLMWHVVEGAGAVALRDVVAALAPLYWDETDAPTARFARTRCKPKRGEPSALGWRCALFDLTRWWAYDHDERDASRIADECAAVDARMGWGLPLSVIASTARSIGRFMATTYRPRVALDDRRGRDAHLVAGLALPKAQAVAARETNRARRDTTDAKLREGLARLHKAGTPLTQAALAAASGLSLRTVKDRWHEAASGSGGMVHDGVLSGGAGPAPALPASSRVPESLSFHDLASQARQEMRLVARFEGLAARMCRRGARVLRVPDVPLDVPPAVRKAVREARRKAMAARADAERRRDDRRERRRQVREREQRRTRFAAWAADRDLGAWHRYRVGMERRWDARGTRAELVGDKAWELHQFARQEAFHRVWKEWRAAWRWARATEPGGILSRDHS